MRSFIVTFIIFSPIIFSVFLDDRFGFWEALLISFSVPVVFWLGWKLIVALGTSEEPPMFEPTFENTFLFLLFGLACFAAMVILLLVFVVLALIIESIFL